MAFTIKSRQALQSLMKRFHRVQQPLLSRFMSTGISHKLFIGGLSWSTDEHSLRDAFSSYGEISEVKVVQDRDTGRSKGFGFVSFTSTEDAESAKNSMDGKNLNGRNVRVDFAMEKPPSARTFGGFGAAYSDSTSEGNTSQSFSSVSTSQASSLHDSTFTQAASSSFDTSSRDYSSGSVSKDSDSASSSRFSSSFDTCKRKDFESDEDGFSDKDRIFNGFETVDFGDLEDSSFAVHDSSIPIRDDAEKYWDEEHERRKHNRRKR